MDENGTAAVQERLQEEPSAAKGEGERPAGASAKRRKPRAKARPKRERSEDDGGAEAIGCRNRELGRRGEDAAARFLDRRGYDIVERNWTCAAGEVDIIARDGEALVFVEVKTRSNTEKGLPSEAVDAGKRRRYERIAALFLVDYDVVDVPVRFDVVSIVVVPPDRAFIRHHIGAFSAG